VESPLTVIERRPGWQLVNLRELWSYRELLYFLAWRDVKVRYTQTALGVAWAVLQPLATMAVFSVVLGRVAGIAPRNLPYSLFVFAGILPWTLFSNAVTSSSQSVVASQNLVTKVYFPRLLIPMGSAAASLVDFASGLGLLVLLIVGYGVTIGWRMAAAPLVAAGLMCAALGVGTLFAALTVAYRDFRYVLTFAIQLWMLATPSIYMETDKLFSGRSQQLLALNPAHGLIGAFRAVVIGGTLDVQALLVSSAVSAVLLVGGVLYFRRVERRFADIV
jgi:lipopolysaccharide transport system permease protein